MEISGMEFSTIDFPKKASTIIFLSGCNFRCSYCHNLENILKIKHSITVKEFLKRVDPLLTEAIVISGGEPTLQEEIIELAREAKDLGYLVKLDTNGTRPEVVSKILEYLDYIAIDVKCPFYKYRELTRCKENEEEIKNKILKTINLSLEAGVYVECRTTYIPKFMDSKDIEEIAKNINCNLYVIQQYDPTKAYDKRFREFPMPKREELEKLKEVAERYLTNVKIRCYW
ncbi:anaerobic ribonucleoside-triphosphate reductase activating protein [Methanocaldococcus infernus]